MPSSGFPEFDVNELTASHNDNSYYNDSIFDWNLLNSAGPSQPYMGADVQGDLNDYPQFLTPATAPISLHPTHEVSLDEGKLSHIPITIVRKLTF